MTDIIDRAKGAMPQISEIIAERREKAAESRMMARSLRSTGRDASGWNMAADYADTTAEVLGLIPDLIAEVERLRGALRFYADKEAWTQPPVRVFDGEFGPAYQNAASKMQMDRGKIALAALAALEGGAS